MRAQWAEADRKFAVREAARAWQRANWIDAAALAAIETAYADDSVRAGPAFRVLYFILTVFMGASATAAFATVLKTDATAACLAASAVCVAATEYLMGPMKRLRSGFESAASLLALLFAVAAVLSRFWRSPEWVTLAPAAALAGLAAWRWGYWIYAAASAVLFFAASAHSPSARLIWIAAPLALFRLLLQASESAGVAPRHRTCAAAVLAVCAGALYGAINPYSLEHFDIGRRMAQPWLLRSSALLTALVPIAFLWIGIRSRRRLLWTIGAAAGVASLVTLRFYVHVAPLWFVLAAGGTIAIAAAVALRRFLDSGRGKERSGLTAEPLLEDPGKKNLLEVAVTVARLAPKAAPAAEAPRYRGGGGEFGGGGASGSF